MWQRFSYCYEQHSHFVRKSIEHEKFFYGQQWNADDIAAMKEHKKPHLTINITKSHVRDLVGEYIQSKYKIRLTPKKDADIKSTKLMDSIREFIYSESAIDEQRQSVYMDSLISDRGFFEVVLDTTKNLTGHIRINYLDPKMVIPDPAAKTTDPKDWQDVFTYSWASYNDLVELFGRKQANKIRLSSESASEQDLNFTSEGIGVEGSELDSFLDDSGYGDDEETFTHLMKREGFSGRTSVDDVENHVGDTQDAPDAANLHKDYAKIYRVVTRQYREHKRFEHFVDASTGDITPIPSIWSENQIKAYLAEQVTTTVIDHFGAQLRWATFSGDVLLYDEVSPYPDINVIPCLPMFIRGRSSGVVGDLRDPQIMLNKLLSTEVHAVVTSSNSGWVVKRGALTNMTTDELESEGAKSGLVLEVEDMDGIEKIKPNPSPQGLDSLTQKAVQFASLVTNSSISDKANTDKNREGANPGEAKERPYLRDVANEPYIEALLACDRKLAKYVIACIQTFYTDKRAFALPISADSPEQGTEQVTVNNNVQGVFENDLTIGTYNIHVISQPYEETVADSEFEALVSMRRDLEVDIPSIEIVKRSRIANVDDIVNQMRAAASSPELQQQKQLQVQRETAEIDKIKAETEERRADAAYKASRARTSDLEFAKGASNRLSEEESQDNRLDREHQQRLQQNQIQADDKRSKNAQEAAIGANEEAEEARKLEILNKVSERRNVSEASGSASNPDKGKPEGSGKATVNKS